MTKEGHPSAIARTFLKDKIGLVRDQTLQILHPSTPVMNLSHLTINGVVENILDNPQQTRKNHSYKKEAKLGIVTLKSLLSKENKLFEVYKNHVGKNPFKIHRHGKIYETKIRTPLQSMLSQEADKHSGLNQIHTRKHYFDSGGESIVTYPVLEKYQKKDEHEYERAILNLFPYIAYSIHSGIVLEKNEAPLLAATLSLVEAYLGEINREKQVVAIMKDLSEQNIDKYELPIAQIALQKRIGKQNEMISEGILAYAIFAFGCYGLDRVVSKLANQNKTLLPMEE